MPKDTIAPLDFVRVTAKIDRWLAAAEPATPCLVVDLDVVRDQYRKLAHMFSFADICYAVKANPAPEVIQTLAGLGAGFDLASEGEIDRCFAHGIPAARISFGNTVKRSSDIARAYSHGVRLFAFDSQGELEKLAVHAPAASVFCRLSVSGNGADWPLTRKFGCHLEMARHLLLEARRLGLRPVGLSFHVGSQQSDPHAWDAPIAMTAELFRFGAAHGLELDLLNLGGGLPSHYRTTVPPLSDYAEAITSALQVNFGRSQPRLIIEPGRYLVGDAGLLRAQVLLVAQKSRHAKHRWIYLDAGRYNGLAETQGERIQYALRTPRDGGPSGPVILAGPTCDSTDILYEKTDYELPLDLAPGDTVDFLSAGAYTWSYASVEFNGFSPIRTYCL
jgi:ornithine decarboxylase